MRRRRVLAATGLSALGGCLRLTATDGSESETAGGSATTGGTTDGDSAADATGTTTEDAPAGGTTSLNREWKRTEGSSSAALRGDSLYAAGGDGLIAFDRLTGDELWTVTTDVSVNAIAATDDGIVAAGRVSADDEESGAVITVGLDGAVEGRVDVADSLSTLTVANDAAFAGVWATEPDHEGPTLFAFGRDDLERRWTASQFSEDSVQGVSVADGTAFVGYANHFATYSAADGSVGKSTDWGVKGEPLLAEGNAYLSTLTSVRALDAASGLEQWSFENDDVHTAPTVADGTLYVGGWDGLYAVERDGSNGRKLVDTGEETYVTTPPLFHAGCVWFLTVDDRLLGYDPDHEQVVSETNLDGRGQWLGSAGDVLYVAQDRAILAFTVSRP